MESSYQAVDAEVETKAREKKLYTTFDINDVDLYISLALQMKIRTDNLSVGNETPSKDLAILYRRFYYYVQDLLQKIPP
jgi:hypothetical protein